MFELESHLTALLSCFISYLTVKVAATTHPPQTQVGNQTLLQRAYHPHAVLGRWLYPSPLPTIGQVQIQSTYLQKNNYLHQKKKRLKKIKSMLKYHKQTFTKNGNLGRIISYVEHMLHSLLMWPSNYCTRFLKSSQVPVDQQGSTKRCWLWGLLDSSANTSYTTCCSEKLSSQKG